MIILGLTLMVLGFICVCIGFAFYAFLLLFKRINIWVAALINVITCKVSYEKGKKDGMKKVKKEYIYKCPYEEE